LKNKTTFLTFLVTIMAAVSLIGISADSAFAGKKSSKVTDSSVVKVNYTLTVDGKVIDQSKEDAPLEVNMGSGKIIPGFEKAIMGMKVGQKKSFEVAPADAYGEVNPDAIKTIPKDKLPKDIELKPGKVLVAKSADGRVARGVIIKVEDDDIVMNFNHPLAGKTLHFDVEIVSIN